MLKKFMLAQVTVSQMIGLVVDEVSLPSTPCAIGRSRIDSRLCGPLRFERIAQSELPAVPH